MRRAIVAYVPVLHAGYKQLFENYPDVSIYLLDRSVTDQFRPLVKDLRALSPELIKPALAAWSKIGPIKIADDAALAQLARSKLELIMPEDDISHELASRHFATNHITYEPIFLRWDRRRTNAKEQVIPTRTISPTKGQEELMQQANREGLRSSDWFRRVGTLAARDGHIILAAHNGALPTPHTPWIDGDPRINSHQAANLDASLHIHAEAALVAKAARRGLSLEACSIYINTFPCPPCAKLLVAAGISKCYFTQGYSMVGSQQLFETAGVELVRLDVELEDGSPSAWVSYPSKP